MGENRFGVPVLDFTPVFGELISATEDPAMAARFGTWGRASIGLELDDSTVAARPPIACELRYPAAKILPDGLLFTPSRMEEKWILTPTPGLDLTLRASFESRQWRLDDDRALLADAVVQDRRLALGGGVTWSPWPSLQLRAEAGVSPWSELEVVDRRGDVVRRLRPDPTPFVSLGLTLAW